MQTDPTVLQGITLLSPNLSTNYNRKTVFKLKTGLWFVVKR